MLTGAHGTHMQKFRVQLPKKRRGLPTINFLMGFNLHPPVALLDRRRRSFRNVVPKSVGTAGITNPFHN